MQGTVLRAQSGFFWVQTDSGVLECTLRGRVLPVGGIKSKVLAAHRAGITRVILPKKNERDLDDVPKEVRDTMRFHPVSSVDEVLALALEDTRAEEIAAAA